VGNNRVVDGTADAVFARINFKIWGPGSTIPHWGDPQVQKAVGEARRASGSPAGGLRF
jgi:hypothetical protein